MIAGQTRQDIVSKMANPYFRYLPDFNYVNRTEDGEVKVIIVFSKKFF